jgi:hypothetical protein
MINILSLKETEIARRNSSRVQKCMRGENPRSKKWVIKSMKK